MDSSRTKAQLSKTRLIADFKSAYPYFQRWNELNFAAQFCKNTFDLVVIQGQNPIEIAAGEYFFRRQQYDEALQFDNLNALFHQAQQVVSQQHAPRLDDMIQTIVNLHHAAGCVRALEIYLLRLQYFPESSTEVLSRLHENITMIAEYLGKLLGCNGWAMRSLENIGYSVDSVSVLLDHIGAYFSGLDRAC